MCCALSNLIKVCCLRGLWIRADSALTSLKRLAKELELAAPSCANSLQWVILQMHRKQLKKAGDELVPDSRLFKATQFLLLGETQGLFLTLRPVWWLRGQRFLYLNPALVFSAKCFEIYWWKVIPYRRAIQKSTNAIMTLLLLKQSQAL